MGRRATAFAALPLCLAVTLPLSACSVFGSDPPSSEPTSAESQAPAFAPPDVESESAAAQAVDPGWDAPAQEADGTFLSMHENKDSLEYRAVDSKGQVLWTAQRPRVCSAYFVTAGDDGPVAVLMDEDSGADSSLTPTATGYDLVTGKKLWGPVQTPGPLLGNGLVFAGPPKDFIGVGGPRTALNPDTGDVAAAEGEDESSRVIALFGEHLVLGHGSDIVGEDLHGDRLWSRSFADLDLSAAQARKVPWEAIGSSHALVGGADSRARTLIDLRSGDIVASGISEAGYDSSSDTLVTAGSRLRGFDNDGTERWNTPLPQDAEFAAVGAGLVAFDPNGESRSARDGGPAGGDSPLREALEQFGPPHRISASGAALVGDPQSPLLVTNRQ